MRLLLLFSLLCLLAPSLQGQRILLIEKRNSAQTRKLFIGDYIQYQLAGEEAWQEGEIRDLRYDLQLIVLDDRYVDISKVGMLRWQPGWAQPIGISLLTFGVSWSGFAFIGTLTDGDPNTRYRWSDLGVTLTSAGLGLLIPTLFGNRRLRLGDRGRHRLRIVDITF
jgi:hypothetical protein